ncbi:MAG: response regulator transcription factor [Ginsengibacter sp.]
MITEKIRVVIADDHVLVRDGLHMLLDMDEGIEIVAEASNGKDMVQMARQYSPDVVITDLMMPGMGGIEAIREMYLSGLRRIIALSFYESEPLIVEALEAGALGYIAKNAQRGEIIEAIKTVYDFYPYYSRSTSSRLIRLISNSKFNPYTRTAPVLFSEKEKEIIRLICQEKSSEEISQTLLISKRTVDGLRARILSKMNVKTMAGVAIYAIKNAIYFLDEKA